MLKQLLTGHILASLHQFGEPTIADRDRVLHSDLSGERETDLGTANFRMAISHGGQAERLVLACVFLIAADAWSRLWEPAITCSRVLKSDLAAFMQYVGFASL
ncbi:MAG: hypothetical protein U0744_00265 [Gemmataceae bacterium]